MSKKRKKILHSINGVPREASFSHPPEEDCPKCTKDLKGRSTGLFAQVKRKVPCLKCKDGKFKTKKGFLVKCKTCNGTSVFEVKASPVICKNCQGSARDPHILVNNPFNELLKGFEAKEKA